MGIVDHDDAEVDRLAVITDHAEDGLAVDQLLERGDQDCLLRTERGVIRVGHGRQAEAGRLLPDPRGQVGVRREVDGLSDALIQGALGDQQAGSGLTAPGVLLDYYVAVRPAVEPLLQHLALFLAQIGPAAVGQGRKDVPGTQQRLSVTRADPVPIHPHRTLPSPYSNALPSAPLPRASPAPLLMAWTA